MFPLAIRPVECSYEDRGEDGKVLVNVSGRTESVPHEFQTQDMAEIESKMGQIYKRTDRPYVVG